MKCKRTCVTMSLVILMSCLATTVHADNVVDKAPYAGVTLALYNSLEVAAGDVSCEIEKRESIESRCQPEYSSKEKFLLAKVAIAEAEGCSLETKSLVVAVVLNRVEDEAFPNTISDVIYEEHDGVYQFSPVGDGRWDVVEPNEECFEAVELILSGQVQTSALFFESCDNINNWHSRHLEFMFQSDELRFYK